MNDLHVQAPSNVIFLCGGETSGVGTTEPTKSLRDAFNKIIDLQVLRDKEIIQAEDITKDGLFFSQYPDVLAFETDLAQITELILLFCESVGSFAELGAFAMIGEIAERLLVIVRDRFWTDNSFIKLGPLRFLERTYGSSSVFVIDDNDIGFSGNDPAKIDKQALAELLRRPLEAHFQEKREPTTFDATRPGHVIKLIVGLIQDYGALKLEEIKTGLRLFSVDTADNQIVSYLFCAVKVGWIVEKRKGSDNLFFALDFPDAATLPLKTDASIKDKRRRRITIIEHWRKADPPRHAAILEVRRGGV